ncbi:MAG: hypothetical protein V4532_07090 [Pseudomonadota bacterium]
MCNIKRLGLRRMPIINGTRVSKWCLALVFGLILGACSGTPSLPITAAKLDVLLIGSEALYPYPAQKYFERIMHVASDDLALNVRVSVYGHRLDVSRGVLSSIVKPTMLALKLERLCVDCVISGHPVVVQKGNVIPLVEAYFSVHCTPEYFSFEEKTFIPTGPI